MFTMYDSVDTDVVPEAPHAFAAYINGSYANLDAAKKRFPHARILQISVTGDVPAQCYDVESGDYTPEDVPRLYDIARKAGIWRPCFYAQLSGVMPAVKAALNTITGMKREDVRLWVAYYNNTPDLPVGYDAHQFTKAALGRNLDESICDTSFFQPATKPAPAPVSEPTHTDPIKATVEYDPTTGEWVVEKL